jgi:hypothetical protein
LDEKVSAQPLAKKKRPVNSKKKLCGFVSVVIGLWERFLTAITRVIVARGHSHQP